MRFSESISCSLTENDAYVGGEGIIVQIANANLRKGNITEGMLLNKYGVEITNEKKIFLIEVPDRMQQLLLS